jgi:hypothetical protein
MKGYPGRRCQCVVKWQRVAEEISICEHFIAKSILFGGGFRVAIHD